MKTTMQSSSRYWLWFIYIGQAFALAATGGCASSSAVSSSDTETAPHVSMDPKTASNEKESVPDVVEGATRGNGAEQNSKNHIALPAKEKDGSEATEYQKNEHQKLVTEIKEWQRLVALQAHACWAGFDCSAEPRTLPKTTSVQLTALMTDGSRLEKGSHLHVTSASELLADTARRSIADARERAELSFVESESPFLLADLPRLLLNSPRSRGRTHLLHALPALERQAVLDIHIWQKTEKLAKTLNLPVSTLLARRVGLPPDEIRRVASNYLEATDDITAQKNLHPIDIPRFAYGSVAELSWEKGLQGVLLDMGEPDRLRTENRVDAAACFLIDPPTDVRFVAAQVHNGASLSSTVYARACMLAGKITPKKALSSFLFVHAVSLLAQEIIERNEKQRKAHYWNRIIGLRGLALTADITMDEALSSILANQGQMDDLARRQTMAKSPQMSGASFFLQPRPDGSHLDTFFAHLLAGVIDTKLHQVIGAFWETKHQERDAILHVLREIEAQLREGGLKSAFRSIGEAEISHRPALELWTRFYRAD